MKRIVIIALVLGGFLNLNAQELVLLNYTVLSKKYEKSEAAINNEKKSVKPATWFNRGKLMQEIYKIDLEYLAEGTSMNQLKIYYKEPLKTENGEDGNTQILTYERIKYYMVNGSLSRWERTKMVTDDPLGKAYEAYVKTMELDTKGSFTDKVKDQMNKLKDDYKQDGINKYYSDDFTGALEDFEMVLKINDLKIFEGVVDTIMIQYSGIIAREMEDYKKSAMYYEKLTELNYGGPNTFLNIKNDYMALGDSAAALATVEKAFKKYPDTLNVVANLVDLYIKTGKVEKGIETVDNAIKENPDKGELYYWKGRLLLNTEDDNRIDVALENYKKSIELNESLYYVYYDIGFIYFLQGQDLFSQAGLERDTERRAQITEVATEKYNESIPMMQKSLELNDGSREIKKETLDVLKRIYYKLYGVEDQRYKDIIEELDKL